MKYLSVFIFLLSVSFNFFAQQQKSDVDIQRVPRILTVRGTKGGIPIEVGLDKSNSLRSKSNYQCMGGTVSFGATQRNFTGQVIPASVLRGVPKGKNITVMVKARNVNTGMVLSMPAAEIKIE
jgi:hypothetical protein